MHMDAAFPSKYLRASDLQGKTANVIIDRYTFEEIGGDRKLVIYFRGKEKGLATNKTNAQSIAVVYGPEMDDWIGGEAQLYPAMVDYQGKQMEAIRVRIPPRKPNANATIAPNARARAPAPAPAGSDDGFDDEIPF